MRATFLVLSMAGFLLLGCSDSSKTPPKENPSASSGNPITAPVDYLGAVSKAQKQSISTVDSVGINQAIQLFYANEGRYPKSLNEIVGPDYLPHLPAPPAGMKFNYDPATGKFSIVPQ
jgi:hypothetical protein